MPRSTAAITSDRGVNNHAVPRGEKPMSSMRTSSVGVKQSCTSAMLISLRGSFTPACL